MTAETFSRVPFLTLILNLLILLDMLLHSSASVCHPHLSPAPSITHLSQLNRYWCSKKWKEGLLNTSSDCGKTRVDQVCLIY